MSCHQVTGFTIPASVEYIGEGAFRYCDHVRRYESLDNTKYCQYGNDLCTNNGKTLFVVAEHSTSDKYKVGSSIEFLPDFIFSSIHEKVKEIELPFGIKRISRKAFEGYNGKIIIQDSKADMLEKIGIAKERVILSHDYDPDFNATSFTKLFSQNPYRVLDLSTGASQKEVNARHISLLALFDDANSPKYETDDIPSLEKPIRTLETIQKAHDTLQSDMDRLIYSLFWLKSETPEQKNTVHLICQGKGGTDELMSVYSTDLEFDPYMPLQLVLWGNIGSAVEQYLDLIYDANQINYSKMVREMIGTPSTSINRDELNKALMRLLVSTCGEDLLKSFIEIRYKYHAFILTDIIDKLDEKEEPDEIMEALDKAEAAGNTMEEQRNAAYHLAEVLDRHSDDLGPLLLLEYGVQVISNMENAIKLTSNRKARLNLVYDISACKDFIYPADHNLTAIKNAIARVKEFLDIIPPYTLIDQDCSIYESMTSWLMCDSITKLVQEFYPVVGPLSEVYQAGFENKKDTSSNPFVTPRDYMYDEYELVSEMVSNNVIRILNDKIKKKRQPTSTEDIKELQLAYSLLNNCKTAFFFRDDKSRGTLTKTIGAVLLLLRQSGTKPSYLQLFTIQSEDNCWKDAQKSSTALLKYFSIYGKTGEHLMEANALMKKYEKDDEQMWQACKTLANYEDYLKNAPTCAHKPEAEEIIEKKRATNGLFFFINLILITAAIALFILIIK